MISGARELAQAAESWKDSRTSLLQADRLPLPGVTVPLPNPPNRSTERYVDGRPFPSVRVLWHHGFNGLATAWEGAPVYERLLAELRAIDASSARRLRVALPEIAARLNALVEGTRDVSLRTMVAQTAALLGNVIEAAEDAYRRERGHLERLSDEQARHAARLHVGVSDLRIRLALPCGPARVAEVADAEQERLQEVYEGWEEYRAPASVLTPAIAALAELQGVAARLVPLVAAYRDTSLPSAAMAAEWAQAARACAAPSLTPQSQELLQSATEHFDGIAEICATCQPAAGGAAEEPAALARLAQAARQTVVRLQGEASRNADFLELARRFETHWLERASQTTSRHVWAAYLGVAALEHDVSGCALPRPADVSGWLRRAVAARQSAVYQAADARPVVDQAIARLEALQDTVRQCGAHDLDTPGVEAAPLAVACRQHLAALARGNARSGGRAMATWFGRGHAGAAFETTVWAQRAAGHFLAHWEAIAGQQSDARQAGARAAVHALEAAVGAVALPTATQVIAWRAEVERLLAEPFCADAQARALVEGAGAKIALLAQTVELAVADIAVASRMDSATIAQRMARASAHRDALLAQLRQPGDAGTAALWACRVAEHAMAHWRLAQQRGIGEALYALRNFALLDDDALKAAAHDLQGAVADASDDAPLARLLAEVEAEQTVRCHRGAATTAAGRAIDAGERRAGCEALVATMRQQVAAWRAADGVPLAVYAEQLEVEADALEVTTLRAAVDGAVRSLTARAGVPSEASGAARLAATLRADLALLAGRVARRGHATSPAGAAQVAAEVSAGADAWIAHHVRAHAPVDGCLAPRVYAEAKQMVAQIFADPYWQKAGEHLVGRLDAVMAPATRSVPASERELDQEDASWPLYYFQPDLPSWATLLIGARLAAVRARLIALRPQVGASTASLGSSVGAFEFVE